MRYLILLLILFGLNLNAQTANYTVGSSDYSVKNVHDRTILYSVYDTLSGANDTLVISFPDGLFSYSQAALCATWLATGTTTSSFVVLQGRNTSYETWNTISTATYAAEVTSACDNDPEPYAYIRLMAVSAANIAHLRISLCLKEI